MDNRIAIIDTDSIAYTAAFGIKLLDENSIPIKVDNKFTYRDKTEEEVKQALDAIMFSIINTTKATHILGFIKGKNTIKDRKDINPDYKANRTGELPKHYQLAKDYLVSTWKVYETHGHEVDDSVNIARLSLPNSFIVAIDKDLLELESILPHFNWRKTEFITVSKEEADKAFFVDLIAGQQGDGLKCLVGKGKVFANKVLTPTGMLPYSRRTMATVVLSCYIDILGEEKGIEEFYKNYKCLKILDSKEGFEIPEPIPVNELIKVKTFVDKSTEEVPEFDF
jgi:hypothetical protein